MTWLLLTPIEPVRMEIQTVHKSKGLLLEHAVPVWTLTPEGIALRALRKSRKLSLRNAALRACLPMHVLSDLESGRCTTIPSSWKTLMRIIGKAMRTQTVDRRRA